MSLGNRNELAAPYSKRALQSLLPLGEVGPGSRALVAGCQDGRLVAYLAQLGFDAVGIDRCPKNVKQARQTISHAVFHEGEPATFEFTEEPPFDLVIVQDIAQLGGDLFTRDALTGTAHLLATLSPRGKYVCLLPKNSNVLASHGKSCLVNQLSYFPGNLQDSTPARTWSDWIIGRGSQQTAMRAVVGLEIPLNTIAHSDWLSIAEIAAENQVRPCCPLAMSAMQQQPAATRAA